MTFYPEILDLFTTTKYLCPDLVDSPGKALPPLRSGWGTGTGRGRGEEKGAERELALVCKMKSKFF